MTIIVQKDHKGGHALGYVYYSMAAVWVCNIGLVVTSGFKKQRQQKT